MHVLRSYTGTLFLFLSVALIPVVGRAERLRYNIQPKQVIPYHVTITVESPTEVETMQGMITYTGRKVEGENLTIVYQGGLSKTTKLKGRSVGRRFGPRGGPPSFGRGPAGLFGPSSRGLMQTKNTLVVSNTGILESLTGDSQLPYLMGNLCMLPFESLPEEDRDAWEYSKGITITSGSDSQGVGPRFGPFANNDEKVKTGGGEVSTYAVQNDDGQLVTIKTSYSLTSPAATKGDSGYAMKGSGTYVFNRAFGLPESSDAKIDLTITGENTSVKFPIKVEWHRMSAEDVAAYEKKREEQKAALQARLASRNKPWALETRTRVMKNLTDEKWETVLKELKELRKSSRTALDAADVDVAVQTGVLRSHENADVQAAADVIWKKWGAAVELHASEKDKVRVAAAEKRRNEMQDANPFKEETATGMRTWSDRTGRFKIEAEFVELDGATVVLKRKDGKTIRIPKARLSEADLKLIK